MTLKLTNQRGSRMNRSLRHGLTFVDRPSFRTEIQATAFTADELMYCLPTILILPTTQAGPVWWTR